ncbi:MAG: hypothetical protein IJT98_08445 [Prevotella sp.]|nr:hypothetical protein [Prevotella sp.]
MNLYLRYFNKEILVKSADEAIGFLAGIDEINLTPELEADVREYANSDVVYPKRYKVRPRVYFIIIKTEAQSMQDFKDKKALHTSVDGTGEKERSANKVSMKLNEERQGWYEGTMDFKRVQMVPGTGKFQYRDTHFVAQLKASSPLDCYNRIVEHLKPRVDERSQFPSAKGKNFKYKFLGKAK